MNYKTGDYPYDGAKMAVRKKSILKRTSILLILGLCVGISVLYAALNSKWFLQKILISLLNSSTSGAKISRIDVGRQRFTFFPVPALHLEDVTFLILSKGEGYSFDIKDMYFTVERAAVFTDRQNTIKMIITNLKMESALAVVTNGNAVLTLDLTNITANNGNGYIKMDMAEYGGCQLTNIASNVRVDREKMIWDRFQAGFYEGRIKGKVSLDYGQYLPYRINVKFKNVNVTQLEGINSKVFSQLHAFVDGSLDIQGDTRRIHALKCSLDAPDGGRLKASVMNQLLDYLPSISNQRKELEKLIKTGGYFRLDEAYLEVENTGEDKLSNTINLVSDELNLNANLSVDINIEGGLQNIFQYFKKISKPRETRGQNHDT